METDHLTGKLAVILHADIVSSTRLVQQDEHLAHARMQDAFRRFGSAIETYHGRVRELRGDALLAEFERASDAVSATLAFQAEQRRCNETLEDAIVPVVRVGIALGEVVIADNTITGAGVVLAQRVEQLAEPGGLCITSAIREALPGRMPFTIQSLGEQLLKGFDEPVQVCRVGLMPGESVPAARQGSLQPQWRAGRPQRLVVALIVLAVVVVTAYWALFSAPREEPASIDRMAFPLPDKPSIAVLPFDNLSADSSQDFFSDGITENLITDLSKLSGLFVIARNSSFSYKGRQVKVRQVAEELGVRYVMEGSVQRAGDQVRINAQLIDATTGGHLWADRYDGSLADVFALQDRVTARIVEAMSVTLTAAEQPASASAGSTNTEAQDAYLQGLSFYLRNTPADNAKAETFFKRALELDPEFERASIALAKVYYKGRDWEYGKALVLWWRKSVFRAYRTLETIDGENSVDAHVLRAQMALNKHQLAVALDEANRALALNNDDVEALKVKAAVLIYSGQYDAGRQIARRVIRIDPVAIAEPLYLIGLADFASGDYQSSVEQLNRATENDPATALYVRLLAAAYGNLGMPVEAGRAWRKFRQSWRRDLGQFWIAAAVQFYPFQQREILQRLADGFEAAGGVERPPSRFLQLDGETRLSGAEIKSLMFGRSVKGTDYWLSDPWQQHRSSDGKVSMSQISTISTAIEPDEETVGESWVEGDRLCDRWSETDGKLTLCVLIFRDPERGPNHYYMVTDTGPHPFQVIE